MVISSGTMLSIKPPREQRRWLRSLRFSMASLRPSILLRFSYRFIVGFNLTLIVLGVAGVLPPTTSALLHNGSTLGISLRNMTDLLDESKS